MSKTLKHKKLNKGNSHTETLKNKQNLSIKIKFFVSNWGVLFLNSLIIVSINILSVANNNYLLKETLVLSTIIACLTMLSTLESKNYKIKESNQLKNR